MQTIAERKGLHPRLQLISTNNNYNDKHTIKNNLTCKETKQQQKQQTPKTNTQLYI